MPWSLKSAYSAFGRPALLAIGVAIAIAVPAQSRATPFDAIYVLGDSLSDQGNLAIATSPLPGVTLIPDPVHYFNGRFSNGPVYTDLLSQHLGLPLTPSLLGGTNFAFGGARTTYNVAENFLPVGLFPWSLNAETAAFANRGINDPNGLYIVFSGANDIGDILSQNLNPAAVYASLLNGIQMAIDAFKAAGAQTILVPNVPDLGLTPDAIGSGTSAAATALSAQYNALLHAQLAAVMGVDIIEFNTFQWLQQVVTDPASFGLTNVNTPCYSGFIFPDPFATECSDPSTFLFWDIDHPSAAGQALLADKIFDALPGEAQPVPEPSTISVVLAGMFLFVVAGRTVRKRRR